jgi:serine/threonine-protein kinase 24/25/MST4
VSRLQAAVLELFTKQLTRPTARLLPLNTYALSIRPNGAQLTFHLSQIDLESSEDDIQEIQQEISVLATCASAYVTQYKASFLKGHKLWIVMEYLGGGSCLDLVCPIVALRWDALLTVTVKTRKFQ